MRVPDKSHFNDKKLTQIVLDEGTDEIGSWAFAKCVNLREIWIPSGCRVSDRAFEDCPALEEIYVYETASDGTRQVIMPYTHLLALAVRNRPAEADLMIRCAGLTHDDGASSSDSDAGTRLLDHVDTVLPLYLSEPDDAGYEPFLAGGEEDYADADAAGLMFAEFRRREKVRLVYERLAVSPVEDLRLCRIYTGYLKAHNPDVTFAILTEGGPHIAEYRALYFEEGLQADADTQTLLDIASRDTVLRAEILTRISGLPDALEL